MIPCWSCQQDTQAEPVCPACGKLQPARPRDAFAVLGLGTPRYHLDEQAIEKAWRELSRKVHPDRFAKADPRERRFALEQTTQLNDARKTLKHPTRRAEYLFKQAGYTVPGEEAGKHGAGEVLPLEFYEQVMDDREALGEARQQGPEAVQKLADRVLAQKEQTLSLVEAAFTAWEASGDSQVLAPAVVELAKVKYFDRFIDEVEGRPHE